MIAVNGECSNKEESERNHFTLPREQIMCLFLTRQWLLNISSLPLLLRSTDWLLAVFKAKFLPFCDFSEVGSTEIGRPSSFFEIYRVRETVGQFMWGRLNVPGS